MQRLIFACGGGLLGDFRGKYTTEMLPKKFKLIGFWNSNTIPQYLRKEIACLLKEKNVRLRIFQVRCEF